mmetsp:Transcript_132/g.361  ORF Transcript_132/g.361 Transcript_132/m.361 type:complete len:362 (+) Transcript_132:109-1194(+)
MTAFEEQVRALQGVWQEKTQRNWSVVGVEAFLVKKDGTKGKRYTMTEGRDGYAIWGSGKFILDPKFQVGSDTARWYDSKLQKVQFEWYFLRDHPVGSEDALAEIVRKPRPTPQRPPGLWSKGKHSKGSSSGYEAGSWASSYWAPVTEPRSRSGYKGAPDTSAWTWGAWSYADSKGDKRVGSSWTGAHGSGKGAGKGSYSGNYGWYSAAPASYGKGYGKDYGTDTGYYTGKRSQDAWAYAGSGKGADYSWQAWGASGQGKRQGKGKQTSSKSAGKAPGRQAKAEGTAAEEDADGESNLSPDSPAIAPAEQDAEERRYDPERGETATYAEFRHHYGQTRRKQEIEAFWASCTVVPEECSIARI